MSPLAPPLSSLARALLLGAGLLALGGCLDDEAAAPQADLQEVGIYQVRSAPQALSLTLPGRAMKN